MTWRSCSTNATLVEGDIVDTNVGGDYDRVVLSFVLHNFDAAGRTRVLRRAADALTPYGRIGVLDWALPPGRVRGSAWRRFLTRLEPSAAVVEVLAGALEADVAAAGLPIDHHRPAAGGRAQILVLRRDHR